MAIQILCHSENETQAELDTPSNDRVRDKSYSSQKQMETRHQPKHSVSANVLNLPINLYSDLFYVVNYLAYDIKIVSILCM